jgi:tRNA 2-thiocytidine biosynthesis protein TtcA
VASPDPRKAEYEASKRAKRLRRLVGEAIHDYRMIEHGDVVMVCLSGGKDSYTMLEILQSLQRSAPVEFDIVAVNLDQKQPDFPEHVLPDYLAARGVRYRIVEEDTYSIVKATTPEGKTYCPMCSRLRRGILYRVAAEIGATKIALGHHMDDVVATLLMNMFHGGRLKAMPPKLLSDDKRHVVIRPLFYCREHDIARFATERAFPIIPCNLCGSQAQAERRTIGRMLTAWDAEFPGRVENIARSLRHTTPSHLADAALYDFEGLAADPGGHLIPLKQLGTGGR